MSNNNQEILKRIDNAIEEINKKESNLFFFVVDSKTFQIVVWHTYIS